MNKFAIVVDTNLWYDVERVFSILRQKTGKKNSELWEQFDTNSFSDKEKTNYKHGINFINRLLDFKNNSGGKEIEIHVPSFVYNEMAYSTSSKITNPSKGSEGEIKIKFDRLLKSMPKELGIVLPEKKLLEAGKHYPSKLTGRSHTDIESEMKVFLRKRRKKDKKLKKLLQHLENSNDENMLATQKRTTNLKVRITDAFDKYQNWDVPMAEAMKDKPFEISYDTKTKHLSSIYGKIIEYPVADERLFRSGPEGVLAERLTMNKEEFDFFDLQMYMYAKANNAIILTANSQAFQEVNDPRFLGYFKDIKIMHPLINFDKIDDLETSADLIEIIEKAIEVDFNNDVRIFRKVDEKLGKRIMRRPVEKIIRKIKYDYNTSNDKLKNIIKEVPLGQALKVLKFEGQYLKLSKKLLFSEPSSPLAIRVLRLVDKDFFLNKLRVSHFFIDSKIKTSFEIAIAINVPGVQERLRNFLRNEGANLKELIEGVRNGSIYFGKSLESDRMVNALLTALFIESNFQREQIKYQINSAPSSSRPLQPKKFQSGIGAMTKEALPSRLTWKDVELINEIVIESDPEKSFIDSERFLEHLDTIKDQRQRIQLIEYAQRIIISAFNDEKSLIGSREVEPIRQTNRQKAVEHLGKVGLFSDVQKENQFPNEQRIDWKPNVDISFNNNYNSVDLNSTLSLLDVLVRNYNDSKYKLPAEDHLSPQEKVEKKVEALTRKLELDPDDVVGSLEEQHRKLLKNLSDF